MRPLPAGRFCSLDRAGIALLVAAQCFEERVTVETGEDGVELLPLLGGREVVRSNDCGESGVGERFGRGEAAEVQSHHVQHGGELRSSGQFRDAL